MMQLAPLCASSRLVHLPRVTRGHVNHQILLVSTNCIRAPTASPLKSKAWQRTRRERRLGPPLWPHNCVILPPEKSIDPDQDFAPSDGIGFLSTTD